MVDEWIIIILSFKISGKSGIVQVGNLNYERDYLGVYDIGAIALADIREK